MLPPDQPPSWLAPAPPSGRGAAALAAGVALLGALAGCDDPAAKPATAAPPHQTAAAIPSTPLAGQLRGRPFTARDARFRIDRRPGYERVDILLSDATAATPCGALTPADPPRIWLRLRGATALSSAELRLEPGTESPWEVHYQLREDGRWLGSGDGAATLRLDVPDAGFSIAGALSVCFADGAASCASGSFSAAPCPDAIDVPVRGMDPTESPAELPTARTTAAPTAAAPPPPPTASSSVSPP